MHSRHQIAHIHLNDTSWRIDEQLKNENLLSKVLRHIKFASSNDNLHSSMDERSPELQRPTPKTIRENAVALLTRYQGLLVAPRRS